MRHTALVTTAAVLLLASCSNGSSDAKEPAAAKKPTPPAPTVDAPTNTADAKPNSGPLPIGQSYTRVGPALDEKTPTTVATTVLGYSHDLDVKGWSSEALGADDPLWVAIDIKVCNNKGGVIAVSQTPWSLGFPDDSRVESLFLDGPGLPKPEYPLEDAKVKPGDCIRGKIPFVLEKGQRPDRIFYETFSTPEPVEWTVPKR